MSSSSSTCTNNNRKLVASSSATCILGAAGALSLLSIVYLLSIVTNSSNGDAYAQQYNAPPQPTTHSFLIQKTFNNITNNNILSDVGTATTKVKPDKVTLNLGVETTNQTAKAALSTNSATMNKVLNVLLSAGVKQNETSTSAFSISPNYNYSQGRNIITGFTVTNSIQIESSKINDTARWIDTAISSGGATSVNSIGFTLSDKKLQEIKNGLIKQAINN
ncbi:MAG: SIMPL domain-containing protein, partial [Thermoproteota archaeon]|nr:SIMPL domain-containing protein [Thermoproteota archaeon]